jgi:hypothetical protein
MVTITNDYGTFSGETEAKALAAARKGKKEAAKRQEEAGREYNAALTEAAANGFKLLCRVVKGEPVVSRHGEWFPASSDASRGVFDCFGEHKTEISAGVLIGRMEPVAMSHPGWTFRGLLLDGTGWAVGYLLTNDENVLEDHFYAIGTAGQTMATTRVPGITLELLSANATV